jgi:uncharacterized damage-inducible protein DinB
MRRGDVKHILVSMAISGDVLRLHLEYNRWASACLLDAAAALTDIDLRRDFGTADKSVIGTLTHIYGGDRVWLARVRGDAPLTLPHDAFDDVAALGSAWKEVSEGWAEWARPMTDTDFEPVLAYRDLKGNPWQTPLWQIVLHVVNHGTHHRGQVSGFLRAMGHTPKPLDLIAYYRALGLAAAG